MISSGIIFQIMRTQHMFQLHCNQFKPAKTIVSPWLSGLVGVFLFALPAFGQGREMTPDEVDYVKSLSEELRVAVLNDSSYEVWAFGTSLSLFKGTRVLDSVSVHQYRGGVVQRIQVSDDGNHVFVDGMSDDWLVEVVENEGQMPELALVEMPQFFTEKCGWWKLFNDECVSADWEFDPISGTMAAEGFRKYSKQSELLTIPE